MARLDRSDIERILARNLRLVRGGDLTGTTSPASTCAALIWSMRCWSKDSSSGKRGTGDVVPLVTLLGVTERE